ncbi:MAG: M48 family metallopeptidase [Thermodesulfovibrionia bacterium]|nr:M48 family metallopeptidase [Thermodesulfovibrionia bacterium]
MFKRIVFLVLGMCIILSPFVYGFDLGKELLNGIGKVLDTKTGQNKGVSSSPDTEEIAVGRQIAGNLLGASPLVKDNALQKYVNSVGRWVANQSERPDLQWHFGVIESGDVNAFSMPGGYIFVTQGLYLLLQNEAQLAGVLAHEIGHVVRKHHYRVIQQAKVMDFGTKLLSREIGQDNELVQRLIGSGAEVVARGLDKNAEYEADRMGVVLSARAGYDQYALAEVLQQMGHYSKEDDSVKLLFKTHPLPDERLSRLDKSMGYKLDDLKGATVSARFYKLKKK